MKRGEGKEGERERRREGERMFAIIITLNQGICEFIGVQAVSSLWLLIVPHH